MKNNKQKVYWLSGLPASGKSSFAKELVANSNGTIKRVNKDDIRAMLDAKIWSKEREKFVVKIQNHIIVDSLCNGYSVVCDNTNFAPVHLDEIKKIIAVVEAEKNVKIELVEKFFDVPLMECVLRDAKRGDASVGPEVIYRMYAKYLMKGNSR
jgi:predicted kinase